MKLTAGFLWSRYLLCLALLALIASGSFLVLMAISEGALPDSELTNMAAVPFRVLGWPALTGGGENMITTVLLVIQILIYPLVAERIIYIFTRKK